MLISQQSVKHSSATDFSIDDDDDAYDKLHVSTVPTKSNQSKAVPHIAPYV